MTPTKWRGEELKKLENSSNDSRMIIFEEEPIDLADIHSIISINSQIWMISRSFFLVLQFFQDSLNRVKQDSIEYFIVLDWIEGLNEAMKMKMVYGVNRRKMKSKSKLSILYF